MIEVDKNRLYRGPRPVDMTELKAAGITTIISLQEGWFEFLHGQAYAEDEQARIAGIELVHVRFSDFCPPSVWKVKQCLAVIDAPSSRPVYVHCKHGVDRTGFLCAAYRVKRQDWTVNAAVAEWWRMGFHKSFYSLFHWESAFRKMMGEWS